MTPVVILVIDIRELACFLPVCVLLHLFCFEISPVVYVITVAARAGLLITPEGAWSHHDLAHIIDVAQVANLVLSLLTNALATSIIAVKSWYVRSILDVVLTCTSMTHARVKRIYRKSLLSYNVRGQTSTLASKVMGLLVESGMLYILISVSPTSVHEHGPS